MPDLDAVSERILSGLRVGKQAPEYKRTLAVIDRFIALVRVAMMGLNSPDPTRTPGKHRLPSTVEATICRSWWRCNFSGRVGTSVDYLNTVSGCYQQVKNTSGFFD
jgi:hypothetical protein